MRDYNIVEVDFNHSKTRIYNDKSNWHRSIMHNQYSNGLCSYQFILFPSMSKFGIYIFRYNKI